MKKIVLALVLAFAFYPAATAGAQAPSECSSIEQKSSEAPIISGQESPANILMSLVATDEFEFIVTANPGYTLSFIQLVYQDSVSTRIVMPSPEEDFTTHWQTGAFGKFEFYKVSGCLARQASTTIPTTSTTVAASTSVKLISTTTSTIRINQFVSTSAQPVIATPSFTG